MNRKVSKRTITFIFLTITVVSLALLAGFSQTIFRANASTSISPIPKQPLLPTTLTDTNETNKPNTDNFKNNSSSTPPATISNSQNKQSNQILTQIHFSLPDNKNPAPPSIDPISLDASKFATYTYGGYSVEQSTSNQLYFSFPDNTNQGEIAGSDALTLSAFTIQRINFNSVFNAPKINALGFDEMVIFAASDASTYKGTEFGVRLGLNDGFICGYSQEPNGNFGEVNFQMLKLMPNDGMAHYYSIIVSGSEVSFYIDGVNYGYLNFPSNTDYSNLTFRVLAIVHRFTDNWDSSGDYMVVENFSFNQQQ
jgi:hypothetical protein